MKVSLWDLIKNSLNDSYALIRAKVCKDVPSSVGPVKIHISMCKAESLLSIFIEALDLWLFTDRPVNTDKTALMPPAQKSWLTRHMGHAMRKHVFGHKQTADTQSDQGLCCLQTELLDTTEYMKVWYFAHAQDDMNLHNLCSLKALFRLKRPTSSCVTTQT